MASPLVRALRFALPLGLSLFGLEAAVRFGASRCRVHQAGKINMVMAHEVDPELAIFGASNALINFDAAAIERATGMTTFDFGMDGTPFLQYQALLREYLSYSKRGKDVVLAETFMTFIGIPALRAPSRYLPYFHEKNVHEVFALIDPTLTAKMRFVPLYSFVVADQDYYKASLRGYLSLLGRPVANSEVQGFFANDKSWPTPAAIAAAPPPPPPEAYATDPRAERDYTEMIGKINAAGKRVILVVTPVQESCLHAFPHFEAHRQKLRALIGGRNVYLDYAHHPMTQDKGWFYNCGHLNRRGATEFARVFARDHGALPQRD